MADARPQPRDGLVPWCVPIRDRHGIIVAYEWCLVPGVEHRFEPPLPALRNGETLTITETVEMS